MEKVHININSVDKYTAPQSPVSCKCYKTGSEADKAKGMSELQLPDSGKRIKLVVTSTNIQEHFTRMQQIL